MYEKITKKDINSVLQAQTILNQCRRVTTDLDKISQLDRLQVNLKELYIKLKCMNEQTSLFLKWNC